MTQTMDTRFRRSWCFRDLDSITTELCSARLVPRGPTAVPGRSKQHVPATSFSLWVGWLQEIPARLRRDQMGGFKSRLYASVVCESGPGWCLSRRTADTQRHQQLDCNSRDDSPLPGTAQLQQFQSNSMSSWRGIAMHRHGLQWQYMPVLPCMAMNTLNSAFATHGKPPNPQYTKSQSGAYRAYRKVTEIYTRLRPVCHPII